MAAAKKRESAPHVQLKELEGSLRGDGPLAPAYVLKGDERYFREKAIDRLTAAGAARGLEICKHDATGWPKGTHEFDRDRLLDDLSAQPLFASARMVIVRGADPLLKKEGSKDSATTRLVKAIVADEKNETCVVIAAGSLRADHTLVKTIAKAGGPMLTCRKLWDGPPPWDPDPRKSELVQWFQQRAQAAGQRVTPDEALFVVTTTGNDLFALETQLEKLRSGSLSLHDVAMSGGWSADGSPFVVAEDLLRGRLAEATSGLEGLFRAGFRERDGKRLVDPAGLTAILIGTMARKLRQILAVAGAVDAGEDQETAAGRLGVNRSPRSMGEFTSRFGLRGSAEWRAMLDEVTVLERRTRSAVAVDVNDFAHFALRWRVAERGRTARR